MVVFDTKFNNTFKPNNVFNNFKQNNRPFRFEHFSLIWIGWPISKQMRHLLCRLFAKTESSLWHLRFYFWLFSFLFLFSATFSYCSFHFPSLNVLFLSVNLQSCFFIYSVSLCFCSNCFLICLSVQSSAKPILTNFRDLYLIHSLVHDMLIRYFCHLLWKKTKHMCVKLTYIIILDWVCQWLTIIFYLAQNAFRCNSLLLFLFYIG
jgi:hypothetical protein